jgi:putative ABC transport system substrate-binding protein
MCLRWWLSVSGICPQSKDHPPTDLRCLGNRRSDFRFWAMPALAADLVRRQVAVIVANGESARAAKAATATIPVIAVTGSDPVRTGLVASLNRPGGNITGVIFDLAAKQLGLLHELVPKSAIIGVLVDASSIESEARLSGTEEAGRVIGLQVLIARPASERDFNAAFAAMVQGGASALVVTGGPLFLNHRRQLVALAARYALPAIYVTRQYPEAGGLMSYGPSQTDAYRRAGIYAARILRGENPSNLPVQLPTKFDLVINLGTAKAFDIDVPDRLLALADEMIE